MSGDVSGRSAPVPSAVSVASALRPPRPFIPAWAGDALAVLVIFAFAFAPMPIPDFRPDGLGETLLAIAPAFVLPWRRRWPLPVLAVCLALYGAAAWSGLLSPGIGLGVAISMFGAANRSTRRQTVIIGSIAIVVVFVLSIPAALENVFDPRVFQFVFGIAFAAAAGDGARSRREYIAAITERAERAEQTRESEASRRVTEERLRLARDLHDTVAHQIAVISLNAGVASSALRGSPDRAESALGTIRVAARTVLGEIGGLLQMLRADEDAGVVAPPQPGVAQLDELIDQFRRSGLLVQSRIDGELSRITGAPGLVAYRVVQEALTNAHKHGAEHRAHLLLEVSSDAVRIVVTNPVDTPSIDDRTGTGVGLIGLRERVASVHGTVLAGPAPGGWKVDATLPLRSPSKGAPR